MDPVSGSDENGGTSRSDAWRTVTRAWNSIPSNQTLTRGRRITLLAGDYTDQMLPNYWELKRGAFAAPIILRADPSGGRVRFLRDINMANVSYFYLLGVTIAPEGGGDAFHCEACDHLLIRGTILDGGAGDNRARETLKVNQSQYVYIENNVIRYAEDNNLDFVAVQYGHIVGNRLHDAGDWCGYVKGGSAYIRVENNRFYNCGTGGFTAGQGTGFQFMVSPWLHYETYDIKIINNLIYNTEGAALGVNGGYRVLVAHNTAYRVGTRSHLLEVVFGERTCDGETTGDSNPTCASYQGAGGWGPDRVQQTPEPIGNKRVSILNNIIYNPSGVEASQHFAVYGPRTPSDGTNIPSPQRTDDELVIAGNVIWNGSSDTPLGLGDGQGCADNHPTCASSDVRTLNEINEALPQLTDAAAFDLRPIAGSNLLNISGAVLEAFSSHDLVVAPMVPEGIGSNAVLRDFGGSAREANGIIGAFEHPESALSPPAIDGYDTPESSEEDAPSVSLGAPRVTLLRTGRRVQLRVRVRAEADTTPLEVTAECYRGTRVLSRRLRSTVALESRANQRYAGTLRVRGAAGSPYLVRVRAGVGTAVAQRIKRLSLP